MKKYFFVLLAILTSIQFMNAQEDKFQWLEEVDSANALEFVNTQNKITFDKLSKEKDYETIYNQLLDIFNSNTQIAYPNIQGKYVYNFLKDKNHVRGIWRRCLLTDYKTGKINWETLLDIDALSKKDNIKWVYKGSTGLYPNYNRFLVNLSNGGGDAVVVREFDADKKQFIENGFYLPEAKGGASYVDENTLSVSTDFGKGSMTTSGYPNQVKLWKRGTDIKDAKLIFEGNRNDVSSSGSIMRDGKAEYLLISQRKTFYTGDIFIWKDNKSVKLDLPEDISINGILNNQLILELKSDWSVNGKTYKNGTLISLNFTKFINGEKDIRTIVVPNEFSSINEIATTKSKLLINMLTDVTGELHIYSFTNEKWIGKKVKAPSFGTTSLITTDDLSEQYFFNFQNFITPSTLYVADAKDNTFKKYQSLPAYFDASKYEVKQFKVKSKDGTMVPYFMVYSKNIKYNSSNPTLVYAYGGFEISVKPSYSATIGTAWLEKGGVYVLANIRGGGEYGPKWHQDGMKEKRQNVFDDLFAVSEDVIAKKVTSPEHMGVMGGSNGGLLVGVAFTQRPDLYNAVVCQVPLLDMQRFNKLLAGASWMGEYGNPDIPEEWEYIKKYSPYQNLKAGIKYPEVMFTTSTRDDRVHPGHARKMNAKMLDMGYKTFYYENTEGGHAGSSTNEQTAKANALTYSYLLMKLR